MKTWFKSLHPMQKILICCAPLLAYAFYEVLRAEQKYGLNQNVWLRMNLLAKLCAIICFLAPFVAIAWAIWENIKKGKN